MKRIYPKLATLMPSLLVLLLLAILSVSNILPVWHFVRGAIAAMVGAICSHPLDLIKVRLQLQEGSTLGAREMAMQIFRQAGIHGFYSGIKAAVLRQFVYSGVRFAMYDILVARGVSRIVAAVIAGGIGALVGCPTDVALVRAQASGSSGNVFQCLWYIASNEGMQGLYAGISACCARAVVVTIGQMATYDWIVDGLSQFLVSPILEISSSVSAGFAAAALSNPVDVIKTRMQTQDSSDHKYNGFRHCVFRIIQTEGPCAFMKGMLPTCIRMVPYVTSMMTMNAFLKHFDLYTLIPESQDVGPQLPLVLRQRVR